MSLLLQLTQHFVVRCGTQPVEDVYACFGGAVVQESILTAIDITLTMFK